MSAATYRMSFMDVPCEVRLNIYEQLFAATCIAIHCAYDESECSPRSGKKYIGLLSTNKMIAKEATPVFFKETAFSIPQCYCWCDFDGRQFNMPFVRNLTIKVDNTWPHDAYSSDLRIIKVLRILDAQLIRNQRMESLVCEPLIHGDEWNADLLKFIFDGSHRVASRLKVNICLCLYESEVAVDIEDCERSQKINVQCWEQDEATYFNDFLKKHGYHLENVAWSILQDEEVASSK